MAQASNDTVVDVFKECYGKVTDHLPQDMPLAKAIPFNEKMKVGEKYVEGAILTNETGITFCGSDAEVVEINPAIAGVTKQVEVVPYSTVLPSVLPWAMVSRSVGGGAKAFFDVSKYIVKNNLRSHQRFAEIVRLYGQSASLLGYVSYATATYRGVAFTTGTGTLNSVAFTTGVNTTSKNILLAPGQFAAGIWVGMEGVRVNQVDSTGAIVASGKLVSVNAKYGYITVDFTPVAASSTTSHRLCFDGMESAKEHIGAHKILATTAGTLFGINNTNYSLFQPNYVSLTDAGIGGLLTLPKFNEIIADAVNKGGLDGDLDVFVNPRTWSKIATQEAGLVVHQKAGGEAVNGFQSVTFWTQAGKATFRSHRAVKEGDAFCMHLPSWSRSGSAEVSFTVPGMPGEIIFPLQNQTGWAFRSFSDTYLFCHQPSWNILIDQINDEANA